MIIPIPIHTGSGYSGPMPGFVLAILCFIFFFPLLVGTIWLAKATIHDFKNPDYFFSEPWMMLIFAWFCGCLTIVTAVGLVVGIMNWSKLI